MAYVKVDIFIPLDEHGKYITVDGGPDENSRFPKTLVAAIRKANFKKPGEVVAEVWCGSVIDEYPAVAEYIDPPASTLDKLCLIEIHDYFSVCEEEAEEPIEHQVGQSDEYYQERVCPPHITTDGEL
ncbi:unnamed protein product [Rotaria sordida]|uniref:Uncharacterized protein n=1 Tax=Rotaria sordida TaxID=392033 RepID=A0A816C9H8_9BILA|nr:unnamed protein product [Rotaria sordida]